MAHSPVDPRLFLAALTMVRVPKIAIRLPKPPSRKRSSTEKPVVEQARAPICSSVGGGR